LQKEQKPEDHANTEKSLFAEGNSEEKKEEITFAEKNQNSKEDKEKSIFEQKTKTETPQSNNKIQNKENKSEIQSLFSEESEPLNPQVPLNDNIKPKNSDIIKEIEEKKTKETEEKEIKSELKELEKEEKENSKKSPVEKRNEKKHQKTNKNKTKSQKSKESSKSKKPEKSRKTKKPSKDKEPEKDNSHSFALNDKHFALKETLKEDEKEIEKLKAKVNSLMKMNKSLLEEMEKRKQIKTLSQEASEDLVNLIEKTKNPLNSIETQIKNTEENFKEKITQKDSEVKAEYTKLLKNLDFLLEKMQKAEKSLEEISRDEALVNGEVKKNYETDRLEVQENIQNDGVTNVDAITSEEIDLGNMKIDLERILFNNPNSEIIVGSNVISLRELKENLEGMENLKRKCGEHLEKCSVYNGDALEKEIEKEDKIIDDVKVLRKETQKVNKGKLLR
jgi:hypothetical protein